MTVGEDPRICVTADLSRTAHAPEQPVELVAVEPTEGSHNPVLSSGSSEVAERRRCRAVALGRDAAVDGITGDAEVHSVAVPH